MNNRKNKKKSWLERVLNLPSTDEYENDFDGWYYEDYKKNEESNPKKSLYDLPTNYEDEELLDKLIMGELLDFKGIESMIMRLLKEFKRTFSAPNKKIEIVFREFKGEDFDKLFDAKKIKEDEKVIDTKETQEKVTKSGETKEGDEDERE